ncbi:MAG: MBL fold metallo-hydrolase [Geodermatophilaceae bacterium]|nr:MBL fold metallo-hydrolase [Geodermatophilaceae bacterium]
MLSIMTGRTWPRNFSDRVTRPLPGPRDFVKLALDGGFRGREHPSRELAQVPQVSHPLPALTAAQTSITWVGHATYVIRTGGLTVLADPLWSASIPGRIRRLTPPGIAWEALPKVDVVVISHDHYDHLDAPTMKRLPRDTPILAPAALASWFTRRGFTTVTELDWWEHVTVDGVRFEFVPAHHWSRRWLFDLNCTLWGGWIIQAAGGPLLYFAGDSAYGERFAEIGRRHPGIDLAMMPIGAYAPRWFMGSAHVDPAEAVQATLDAGARQMAWMHWGAFVLSREPMAEPARLTVQAWRDTGRPLEDLWQLAIGESRVI